MKEGDTVMVDGDGDGIFVTKNDKVNKNPRGKRGFLLKINKVPISSPPIFQSAYRLNNIFGVRQTLPFPIAKRYLATRRKY